MAEENESEIDDALEGDEVPAKKKMAGKTLVLFVILPAVLVLVGGGVGVMMLMGGSKADAATGTQVESLDDSHGETDSHGKSEKDDHGKKDDGHGKKEDSHGTSDDGHGGMKSSSELEDNGAVVQIGDPGEPSFYTMPKILVTVNSGNGRRSQLLLKLTLESHDPSVFDRIDSLLPRITDQFQMFLREMRIDDLSGSAGDYRIRRELLRRVNLSLHPESIDAVLIEEFIVQ